MLREEWEPEARLARDPGRLNPEGVPARSAMRGLATVMLHRKGVTLVIDLGILGCGAIGGAVAQYAVDRMESVRLQAVVDRSESDHVRSLCRRVEGLRYYDDAGALAGVPLDVILEATDPSVVRKHAASLVASGKDLIVMSVGGLVDREVFRRVREAAAASNQKVIVPCGAIAGISAIQAAGTAGEIRDVLLRTTKAPRGLQGAPYVSDRGLDLEGFSERELVFSGNVLQAVMGFPQNLNVSAAVALAGVGPEKTRVEIYADPGSKFTTHELHVRGDFGTMCISLENHPSPDNPRSSRLAALSAISALQKYTEPVLMGY